MGYCISYGVYHTGKKDIIWDQNFPFADILAIDDIKPGYNMDIRSLARPTDIGDGLVTPYHEVKRCKSGVTIVVTSNWEPSLIFRLDKEIDQKGFDARFHHIKLSNLGGYLEVKPWDKGTHAQSISNPKEHL